MKVIRFSIIVLLAFVCTTAIGVELHDTAPGADWPMQRHDSRNTAFSDVSINPPFRLSWRVPACAHPSDVLLASGGAICVGNHPVSITEHAEAVLFDSAGQLVWRIEDAIPVYLKGDRLVVIGSLGTESARNYNANIICYDWKQKRTVWSCPLGGSLEFFFGTIENGGRLYCSFSCFALGDSSYNRLKVVDAAAGNIIAESKGEVQGWAVGPPACDNEHVYFGASHAMTVLDPLNLKPSVQYYDGGNAYPIVDLDADGHGSMLIVKGWEHYLSLWNLTTRKLVWRHGAPRGVQHCLAQGADGQELLIESSSATALPSGKMLWNAPLYGTDSIATRRFVYMAAAGGLYGIDSTSGKIRWKYERPGLQGVSIITDEGSLYAAGSDGCLYRFDPRKR